MQQVQHDGQKQAHPGVGTEALKLLKLAYLEASNCLRARDAAGGSSEVPTAY